MEVVTLLPYVMWREDQRSHGMKFMVFGSNGFILPFVNFRFIIVLFFWQIWQLDTGQCQKTLFGHEDAVTTLTYDATTIISGSLDCTIRLWCISSGQCNGVLDWMSSEGHTGKETMEVRATTYERRMKAFISSTKVILSFCIIDLPSITQLVGEI